MHRALFLKRHLAVFKLLLRCLELQFSRPELVIRLHLLRLKRQPLLLNLRLGLRVYLFRGRLLRFGVLLRLCKLLQRRLKHALHLAANREATDAEKEHLARQLAQRRDLHGERNGFTEEVAGHRQERHTGFLFLLLIGNDGAINLDVDAEASHLIVLQQRNGRLRQFRACPRAVLVVRQEHQRLRLEVLADKFASHPHHIAAEPGHVLHPVTKAKLCKLALDPLGRCRGAGHTLPAHNVGNAGDLVEVALRGFLHQRQLRQRLRHRVQERRYASSSDVCPSYRQPARPQRFLRPQLLRVQTLLCQ